MSSSQHRTAALSRRDRQKAEIIDKKSQIIQQKLFEMPQLEQAEHIFTYLHFRSEVKTKNFVTALLASGKTVSVPLCHRQSHQLEAIKITGFEQLATGAWGIAEPLPEITRTNKMDPGSIDVIIMPGAVFDLQGGRFGYGGGFYDRFVVKIPQALRIALAFDLQLTAHLPLAPHDELVDYIVTEKKIIFTNRGRLANCSFAR